ncbi:ParB N-terminal domain-containing protein [Streptomyces sp. NBC_01221]|uniref:ParB N-terminal domain-containing protein n=1 Tax=Streptomyces sp. NBC_01221 TaxID=2903782 RepID=UPI002253CE51|nr:ParB N-terminal domain-containing protein [Streptomyces sp. NBC_01221]MCX4792523.1 ParB N-terminal domain-containing protein [Streptomyces sp. NBC_01221]
MTPPAPALTRTVPIDDVKVGERDRSDLGNVTELAESIQAVGVLHPVVVTADLHLVAGGRRLAAIRQLGWTEAPVTVVDLATASDVLRAELEENTCRKSLSPMEASFARERRAKVLAPKVQENKGGRPPKDSDPDIPQDGFWVEPTQEKTGGNFPPVSTLPQKTRTVAAIGTGFSDRSIDKVDEIRRVAERGITTVGTGKDRREVEVPEPVREVARKQLPALAQTGAAIEPASQAVKRAMDEHLAKDPNVQQARLLKAYYGLAGRVGELPLFNAAEVAAALDASPDRTEKWDELERLHHSVNQWFENTKQARQEAGLRLLGGSK